jgi:hypothetical protein
MTIFLIEHLFFFSILRVSQFNVLIGQQLQLTRSAMVSVDQKLLDQSIKVVLDL